MKKGIADSAPVVALELMRFEVGRGVETRSDARSPAEGSFTDSFSGSISTEAVDSLTPQRLHHSK
jgi:hypothetical protein